MFGYGRVRRPSSGGDTQEYSVDSSAKGGECWMRCDAKKSFMYLRLFPGGILADYMCSLLLVLYLGQIK